MKETATFSAAEASAKCLLLGVPAEIRLEIYRYLVLPVSVINLGRLAHFRKKKEKAKDPENAWEDQCSVYSDDSDFGDICSTCGERHGDGGSDYSNTSSSISTLSDCEDYKMHLDILSVNHQIHNEASALLYAEAVLHLEPDDIFCLMGGDRRDPKIFTPSPNEIWRHNPIKGIGWKDKNGIVQYTSAKMAGAMEPHIFANFQKIMFEAYFDDDLPNDDDLWINDETLEFEKDQAAKYQVTMKRNPCVKAFARMLSHFRLITHLSISLDVAVVVTSIAIELAEQNQDDSDDESEDDGLNDDDVSEARKERLDTNKKIQTIENAANEKAAELLVDCNLFEPLARLSNVRQFKFTFSFDHREGGDYTGDYTPSPKTEEKLVSLKEKIEGRFQDPDVAVGGHFGGM